MMSMMERCTVALSRAVRRGQTASRRTLSPDSNDYCASKRDFPSCPWANSWACLSR